MIADADRDEIRAVVLETIPSIVNEDMIERSIARVAADLGISRAELIARVTRSIQANA